MRRRLLSVLALGIVLGACARPAAADERHLVLVSIDGLRPEFYLDGASPARELAALADRGARARAAEPVFPSVTYPNHASIVTGVRPARHGILFNVLFEPDGGRGRWYERAADLRATPIWEWARTAGLRTAAVAWPSTVGAAIDLLVPERDYFARRTPLDALLEAATPGLFDRLAQPPRPRAFKDPVEWDEFVTRTAAAMIRDARPHLTLLHLVQLDHFQHRGGLRGAHVMPALARVDGHITLLLRALREAGIAERALLIVTGDHGFEDIRELVFPNEVLARAGLRGCPAAGPGWQATAHVAGGAAAVFVEPRGDPGVIAKAETALRGEAPGRYTVLTRRQLDDLGAMTGAALGIEAAPGYGLAGSCGRGLTQPRSGGTHGYLPSRPGMATGFIAAGAGVRAGTALERMRLIDVAPTAARLLGLTAPPVEGRVLDELVQ